MQKKVRTPAGLYLTKKLKKEHIDLDSYSRMRVDLAAQVYSLHRNRVCSADISRRC